MKSKAYFVCLALGTLASFASAVSESSPPASGPAASGVGRVYAALSLSAKDKLLVSSLRDGTDPPEQNAFYRMMQIVAALPALPEDQLRQIDAPAWANLLRDPNQYRGKPVRLKVRVYVVRKLTRGEGLRANPYWPADKPLYELHATTVESHDEPLILYTATAPENLPAPSETLADGQVRYKTGPAYIVAGVYLQYYTGKSTGGDTGQKYPVILAWQMKSTSDAGSFFGPFSEKEELYTWGAALVVLIAAVGMFIFLHRRLHRPLVTQQGIKFKKYKPLRDEEPEEDTTEDEEYVDPELSSAVEEYQRSSKEQKNDPRKGNEETL